MKLPPTVPELKSSTLPCGYPIAPKSMPAVKKREADKARLRHQRTCPHAYCRWRARAARRMGALLAAELRRQQEEAQQKKIGKAGQ